MSISYRVPSKAPTGMSDDFLIVFFTIFISIVIGYIAKKIVNRKLGNLAVSISCPYKRNGYEQKMVLVTQHLFFMTLGFFQLCSTLLRT